MPIDLAPLSLLLLVMVALAAGGCDRLQAKPAKSSVTVRLPPARPAQPGFDFTRGDAKR